MRFLWVVLAVGVIAAGLRAPVVRAEHTPEPAVKLRALGELIAAGNVDGAVAMFVESGTVAPSTQGGERFDGRARARLGGAAGSRPLPRGLRPGASR